MPFIISRTKHWVVVFTVTRVLTVVAVVMGGLWGCGGVAVERIEDLGVAGIGEPFPSASMARLGGGFDRLVDDIPRAVKQHHWGLLSLRRSRVEHAHRVRRDQTSEVIRARALLPDGREAEMVAWPVGEDRVGMAVRVGRGGDADAEKAFLKRFARVLRGRPSRRHRQGVALP